MIELDKYPFIINDIIYDCETYPNCFTLAYVYADGSKEGVFEISDRKVELQEILSFFRMCKKENKRLVGFNNLGFDSNLVHWIIGRAKKAKQEGKQLKLSSSAIYKYAMKVIDSHRSEGFGISVKDSDVVIKQLDLFKINHYDNKAKMTSLKLLEFNMRLDNVEDLPFPVGKKLTHFEIETLIEYNFSDIYATKKFYELCLNSISFRDTVSEKYGFDCTNLNDGKIGGNFFMRKIEETNPYAFYEPSSSGKRVMRQTRRDCIVIKDCLFPYIRFKRPEFKAIHDWLKKQVITETKGVFSDIEEHLLGDVAKYAEMVTKRVKFKNKPTEEDITLFKKDHPMGWVVEEELKTMEIVRDADGNIVKEEYIDDKGKTKLRSVKVPKKSYYGCYNITETLNVVIDGFRYDYGTGGIHGSICGAVHSDDDYEIWDWDVASFYPNMAISNRIYPEHLSESFCERYEDLYNERKTVPKSNPVNKMYKDALNIVYGDSNSVYSPFYDPKYTMSITIGGQLSLCMLIERLIDTCNVQLIQANTDGFTIKIHKSKIDIMKEHVSRWEKVTGLVMEDSHYTSMYVADVNSYIACYTNGKVKYKGRYEYLPFVNQELGAMHKNHSATIIQMAVAHEIVDGGDAVSFIRNHDNPFDFMLRTKVPRSSKLVLEINGEDVLQQNICRYYASMCGGQLVKIMPPLIDGGEDRRLSIDSGVMVKTCNNIKDFKWDINYQYYIDEVIKLLEPFKNEVYK